MASPALGSSARVPAGVVFSLVVRSCTPKALGLRGLGFRVLNPKPLTEPISDIQHLQKLPV